MCYVFPAGKHKPVVVDMATSSAANGKLEIAQRTGKPIPLGWVQDKDGNDTTDPFALSKGGALLPLGSAHDAASHKGYGLAAVVDIFSAVLSGANYGPWVPPFVAFLDPMNNLPGKGIGHFVGAMRVDAFRPYEDFVTHMDNWIDRFKSAASIEQNKQVIIPGEPEFWEYEQRKKEGIELNEKVLADLLRLGSELGVNLGN
jgi:LDH2 family malate/lactate/ureidoglycolate dehydrogenase